MSAVCLAKYVCIAKIFLRKYCISTLFVTGDKAHKTTSILMPHLDCDERFQAIEKLKKNVLLRGLNCDVEEVHKLWETLQLVEYSKAQLEKKRMEITETIKALRKTNKLEDLEKLKVQGRSVREDLKAVMKHLWQMQEKAIGQFLLLPNDLDPDTPNDCEKILHTFGDIPQEPSECHIEIGKKYKLIKYFGPMCYYLVGRAAIFELKLLQYFAASLYKEKIGETCNSDFVKRIVVEGCGLNHIDLGSVFSVDDVDTNIKGKSSRLHLVGGASLPAFCANHAKSIVTDPLPIRYFSVGRQYNPTANKNLSGLFHVQQASCVEVFVLTSDSLEDLKSEFENMLTVVTNLYSNLGLHFRIVLLPAYCLKPWESLRASIQMFSLHSKSYVETGNLSLCNSYISKRLLMYYETPNKEKKFLQILSGTLISVPQFLGCALEGKHKSELNLPGFEGIELQN